jgi:hypothetical protein
MASSSSHVAHHTWHPQHRLMNMPQVLSALLRLSSVSCLLPDPSGVRCCWHGDDEIFAIFRLGVTSCLCHFVSLPFDLARRWCIICKRNSIPPLSGQSRSGPCLEVCRIYSSAFVFSNLKQAKIGPNVCTSLQDRVYIFWCLEQMFVSLCT